MNKSQENELRHVSHLDLKSPLLKLILGPGKPWQHPRVISELTCIVKVIEHDVASLIDCLIFIDNERILEVTQVGDLDVEFERSLRDLRFDENMFRRRLRKVLIVDWRIDRLQHGLSVVSHA